MNTLNSKPYKLCLNMIVKDESHIIQKTLQNIVKYIPIDYYIICDTGSTDNTCEIIKNFFISINIPGEIHHHKWVHFAHNRNLALELTKNIADYVFIFDADDFINTDYNSFLFDFNNLNHSSYKFIFDNNSYERILLINNSYNWYYIGVIHEVIVCQDQTIMNNSITFKNDKFDYYITSGRTGSRNNNPLKYKDDALLLEKTIDTITNNIQSQTDDDINLIPRYAFYCAQSWFDFGDLSKALIWYNKCIYKYNNWTEEKYYSCIRIGEIYQKLKSYEKSIYYYLLASSFNPLRLEGYFYAATIDNDFNDGNNTNFQLNSFQKYHMSYKYLLSNLKIAFKYQTAPNSYLFVNNDIYNFLYLIETSISCYYVEDYKNMSLCIYEIIKRLNKFTNINIFNNFLDNMKYFSDKLIFNKTNLNNFIINFRNLLNNYSKIITNKNDNNLMIFSYNFINMFDIQLHSHIIKNQTKFIHNYSFNNKNFIKNKSFNNELPIIITMTTCKRFDLFSMTIKSLFYNITDLYKISYFYIIDDNSNEEDINKMKKLIKNLNSSIKLIELKYNQNQTIKQKGHRFSMNTIRNIIINNDKIKYWIHIEDDWLFFEKNNLISKLYNTIHSFTLSNNPEFNNIKQIVFNKGYGETICDNFIPIGKLIQTEKENQTLQILEHLQNQKISIPNSSYWKHFSFRPSIINIDILNDNLCGNFNSPNTFFENDYAEKYTQLNFKTAYLDDIICLHTGKLSGNRGEIQNNTIVITHNAYDLNNENQF